MKINANKYTGGLWCVFEKNGNFYYADISRTPDRGPECMIFHCDKDGNVTDWGDVFCKWYSCVSYGNLRDAVDEFLATFTEESP